MTDKPKLPPPLPAQDRDGADDDETLLNVKVELPPADEWDEAEPTLIGESLETSGVDAADANDETLLDMKVELPAADEWDAVDATMVQEPLSTHDQAATAPRNAPMAKRPSPRRPQTSPPASTSPRPQQPAEPSGPRSLGPRGAETSRSPELEPAKPAAGFTDALPLFIIGGSLGTILMLVIAVRQWLAPWVPMAALMGIAAALSGSLAYLFCEVDRPKAFLKGLAVCAALALPAAVWMVAPVRLVVLEQLGGILPITTYQQAMEDPDDKVAIAACARGARAGDGWFESTLVEQFTHSPAAATACLDKLARTNPDRAQQIAAQFGRRWDRALLSQDSAMVCAAAPQIFELSSADSKRPAQRLTYCAMTAADSETAKCCAGALTDRIDTPEQYTHGLGPVSTTSPRRRVALFTALVAHAFPGIDATRVSLPLLERRLLKKDVTQDWILALGCQTLFDGERLSAVLSGLEAIVESQGCAYGAKSERRIDNWMRICVGLSEQQDSSGRVCSMVRGEAVGEAVGSASAEVRRALDGLFASETGREIVRAHAGMRAYLGSTKASGDLIAEMSDPGRLPAGMGSAQSRQFGRMLNANYPEAAKMIAKRARGIEDYEGPMDKSTARKLQVQNNEAVEGVKKWEKHWPRLSASDRQQIEDAIMVDGRREASQ